MTRFTAPILVTAGILSILVAGYASHVEYIRFAQEGTNSKN